MEKTDKSDEEIVKESNMLRILQNAEDYAFQVPYDGTKIFCDEKKYKSYLDGAKSELKYAALSEYKQIIKELLPVYEKHLKNKIKKDQPYYFEEHGKMEELIDRAKKLIEK